MGLILSISQSAADEALWVLGFSAMVGYPIAIVLGVPTYLVLNRLQRNGLTAYLLASLLFAFVLILLFVLVPMFSQDTLELRQLASGARITQILTLTAIAAFSVTVFWVIARPDKTIR